MPHLSSKALATAVDGRVLHLHRGLLNQVQAENGRIEEGPENYFTLEALIAC
jgi:hypothetical protein